MSDSKLNKINLSTRLDFRPYSQVSDSFCQNEPMAERIMRILMNAYDSPIILARKTTYHVEILVKGKNINRDSVWSLFRCDSELTDICPYIEAIGSLDLGQGPFVLISLELKELQK